MNALFAFTLTPEHLWIIGLAAAVVVLGVIVVAWLKDRRDKKQEVVVEAYGELVKWKGIVARMAVPMKKWAVGDYSEAYGETKRLGRDMTDPNIRNSLIAETVITAIPILMKEGKGHAEQIIEAVTPFLPKQGTAGVKASQ